MSRVRQSRAITTILLALILAIAFAAAVTQKPWRASLNRISFSDISLVNSIQFNLLTSPNFPSPFLLSPQSQCADIPEILTPPQWNATRTQIYDYITANPGVNFRGICNTLGLSIGLAQFHLGVLTKAGLVSAIRDGKYKRFFTAKRFSKKQMRIIAVLRHKSEGSILKTLLEKTQVSHSELTNELSITSQGLTWNMNRLEKTHLITESKDGKRLLYSLDQGNVSLLTEMAHLI
jgi:DNA-binding transcriptional ArsR family regulator